MSDCKTCAKYDDESSTYTESCDECHRVVFVTMSLTVGRGLILACLAIGIVLGMWFGLQLPH